MACLAGTRWTVYRHMTQGESTDKPTKRLFLNTTIDTPRFFCYNNLTISLENNIIGVFPKNTTAARRVPPPLSRSQGHTDSRVECRVPHVAAATSVALLIGLKAQVL